MFLPTLVAIACACFTMSNDTGVARDVTIPGPVPLGGTVTTPTTGKGPWPAVVILQGSGPIDRDGSIGPNSPYRDLATGLTERGIVVLRYDKRTRVNPAWFSNRVFTVKDEITDDAVSAIHVLRQRADVDTNRIVVIGHSLGGMVAPRVAGEIQVAGIVLMAGATRASLPDQIDRQIAYQISLGGPNAAAIQAQYEQLKPLIANARAVKPEDSSSTTVVFGAPAAYFLDLQKYDPAHAARALNIPILALQGERDYQVPPAQLDDWLSAYGNSSKITVKRYPTLSHMFMPGSVPPSPADYAVPSHVDPKVIDDIAAWIHNLK